MKILYTITAWIMFLGALAGLIFSASGLFLFWKSLPDVSYHVSSTIDWVGQSLDTADQGLSIVGDAIDQAKSDLDTIQTFTYDISDAVENTGPTLEAVSDLFREDLTGIVNETQSSLDAVKTSATLIDDTLRIISAIPLIGARYTPSQTLGDSIQQISTSLADLPVSLSQISEGLDTTTTDLSGITASIENLAQRIGEIDTSLEQAQLVIGDFQTTFDHLRANIDWVQQAFPAWAKRISITVSILLVWMSLVSLGLFNVGILLLRNSEKNA